MSPDESINEFFAKLILCLTEFRQVHFDDIFKNENTQAEKSFREWYEEFQVFMRQRMSAG